ncbi:hypothetical protein PIB30_020295 [Stylosanthes scabra]|uniref:Uncharacterized protein n=1 Tax=Stylosanthes scabra TaxID=79078 RepID=A0ABU6V9A5_9FABA|nr:hypothetical protein [Stylosanthes scabra]
MEIDSSMLPSGLMKWLPSPMTPGWCVFKLWSLNLNASNACRNIILESVPVSIKILQTIPGPMPAKITIGASESATPCSKSLLLNVIAGSCGGVLRTVARILRSFLWAELDFSVWLAPMITGTIDIGSSASLRF